jgi:regulation of enolase protein 1 (concanavalin A-like superfamily)
MNRLYAITACVLLIAGSVKGQTKETMKWYQEPKKWSGTPRSLSVTVDSATDYWRITHYGFIRDNGPFYYHEAEGDFEASVKVSGQYKELFHQAGLMIRIDHKNWIKTGIEYVDGVQNVSAVVTREVSDWSVVPRNDSPASIWLKLLRKGDYVEIRYSFDNKDFKMLRLAYFPPKVKAQIGIVAAAPGKLPFNVLFEDFEVKPVK